MSRTASAALAAPDRLFGGYADDLDGTVYLGDAALPGAVETIRRLRDLARGVVFVTNKPLETAADYAAKLSRLGVPCAASDVITATDALLGYLAAKHPGSRVLAVAEPTVQAALRVGAVLGRLGLPASDTAMVGDRLTTDVAMAERTGMAGVLVLSGVTGRGDLERSDVRPRYVIDDLVQLLPRQQG